MSVNLLATSNRWELLKSSGGKYGVLKNPIGWCRGRRVFVCDNLAYTSELAIAKQHTRFGQGRSLEALATGVASLPSYRASACEWKPQFEKALDAFARSGFFILINNQQAESLEQEFDVNHETQISFVKLTMLVGG